MTKHKNYYFDSICEHNQLDSKFEKENGNIHYIHFQYHLIHPQV